MSEFDPFSLDVRAELVRMNNRLIEIENELVRIHQHKIADVLAEARTHLYGAIHRVRAEATRLEPPL